MVKVPDDIDPKLWVIVEGIEGRCYLHANSHTRRGHIEAWSESHEADLTISRSWILDQSTESDYWVRGFLVGNEPGGVDLFGPAFDDELDDTMARRWRDAVQAFRRSGDWPAFGDWQLPCPFSPGFVPPIEPWVLRVDEIWVWRDERWSMADPQPASVWDYPGPTTCDAEGHDMTTVTTCHSMCDICGTTTEYLPEGFTCEQWEVARIFYVPESIK